jgi:hypothetical protein
MSSVVERFVIDAPECPPPTEVEKALLRANITLEGLLQSNGLLNTGQAERFIALIAREHERLNSSETSLGSGSEAELPGWVRHNLDSEAVE